MKTINKFILLILLLNLTTISYSQSKCKFVGYSYRTRENFYLTTYCGDRHHRFIKYGEERYTTGSFYDYTKKRMFYIQKRETRPQYCYSWGYWTISWIHKGFRDDWIEGKIYYFKLKDIEYSL